MVRILFLVGIAGLLPPGGGAVRPEKTMKLAQSVVEETAAPEPERTAPVGRATEGAQQLANELGDVSALEVTAEEESTSEEEGEDESTPEKEPATEIRVNWGSLFVWLLVCSVPVELLRSNYHKESDEEAVKSRALRRKRVSYFAGAFFTVLVLTILAIFVLPMRWETSRNSYAHADNLLTQAMLCGENRNEAVSAVIADQHGAGLMEASTPGSTTGNTNRAKGKVNWLVSRGFDTSMLCQSQLCQWTSLWLFTFFKSHAAQGGVVLLNAEDKVVGVLAVAGNNQYQDLACAQQAAFYAGFTAKDAFWLQWREPEGGAPVDTKRVSARVRFGGRSDGSCRGRFGKRCPNKPFFTTPY